MLAKVGATKVDGRWVVTDQVLVAVRAELAQKAKQEVFEGLRDQLPGGVAMTRLTVQCAIGEGTIATIMESVQAAHAGVSIGSYPWFKPGQFGTAVVVSGLDVETTQKAAKDVETEVRQLAFDAAIVGADGAPVS